MNNTHNMKLSFWFMKDNFTFLKPRGEKLKTVKKDLQKFAKKNPHGMLCPVIVLKNDVEINRIGKPVHVDKDGNVNIDEWIESIFEELKNISDNNIIKLF